MGWGRVVLVTPNGVNSAALTFALRKNNPKWDVALVDWVPGVQIEND